MKAAILCGSSRPGNNTLRVCKALARTFEERGIDTNLVDFQQYDMPFFNEDDVALENLTDFQQELIQTWTDARIVVIVSPEYNWFPSAELVNMVHQLGSRTFQHLFDNKVFAFGGVSTGRGGRLPGMQMSSVIEKLVSHLGKYYICSPLKFESHYSAEELDETGNYLKQSPYKHHLERFVDYTLTLSAKFQ